MLARKLLLFLVPAVVLSVPALRAGETPPALVVQVRSAERVLDHVKLILSLIGREEIADRVEGMLKAKIGPEGVAGVDLKKPLGVVLRFGKGGEDIEIAPLILVPISDETAFLKLLENNKAKVAKGKDGIYTVNFAGGDLPIEVYFRFAKGYAHATILTQTAIQEGKLVDPVKALGGAEGPTLAISARLDQVPLAARQLALAELEKIMDGLKKDVAPEPLREVADFQIATFDAVLAIAKAILMEGQEVKLTLDLDAKAKKVYAHASLSGQPGSGVAKSIEDIGKQPSVFASLHSDKAMFNGVMNAKLPEPMAKGLASFFAEMKKKALAELTDEGKQIQARALFAVLEPTFQQGAVDAFFMLQPTADKTLDYLIGLRMQEGRKLEKQLRDLIEDRKTTTDKDRARVKLDFAKEGGVSIHKIELPDGPDFAPLAELLGDKSVLVAFRDDAVVVALGKGGFDSIKKAIAAKPGPAPMFLYRADMGKLVELMRGKSTPIPAKLFLPGSDNTVLFRIDGGGALTLRMELPLDIFLMATDKRK